ncbi:ROK family transcriptional regulator [Paenarthrobacter aurescens]|uniref:Sugar kinase n=1 Tax=Paenarthrobacter aurescens TaxID=43663 RepID=A0A4Y3NDQ1_PAEAU|nr:ROK family transcriptional regulator [Paenarthrobacter aurescens]MDO6145011.1 ROK family transcriptional regulator [Paenarthrobacter aurescens]MDO6148856.1 ROK family transcriptional regulator [Paenarthrobacter aurescens]MDO6160102.1 ROK family transcriptional regulator [Paenarthrobacter aurescens]MDO6163961.1 ROK family transcriptional regulator [Paenarthrobacter aurescens]GEB17326.1 sugar kinase [Paenarthrobacter aurescens]
MKPRAGSKALIREINEALVLDIVRTQAPVSRAKITVQTGLSAASVTGITGKLVHSGLLVETEIAPSTGGRPARLLELGREGVFAAGVRLSATEAHAVVVDLRGDVVATHSEPLASTEPGEAAAAAARAVRSAAGQMESRLIGVGAAVSGVVDQAGGLVRHSGAMGWTDIKFQMLLEEAVGQAVVVDSFVNAYARGLLFDDVFKGREMLIFSVGTSLGAAVVIEGRIQRGFNGAAGGFAHSRAITGPGPARPCHCGAEDCCETRGSLWGMQQELERSGQNRHIDPDVDSSLIADAALHLGIGMANAAKVLGPEQVVVGFAPEANLGTFAEQTKHAFMSQYLHANTPPPLFDAAIADPVALARGAACSVLAGLFTASPTG